MSRAPMPDSAQGEAPMPSSFDEDLYGSPISLQTTSPYLTRPSPNEWNDTLTDNHSEFWDEGRWSKLGRRLKEEPLVPLGLGLTCYALYQASRSIRRGDKETTNRYFRARVYAQGFTLVCVCAGAVYWREDRQKRKAYQGLLGEKRAREKKEAWIRELEARDREDEIERQRREARRARARATAKEKEGGGESTCPVGDELGMRRLLVGDGLLGSAMFLWRSSSDERR